tara:strand:- start:129 stop:566 length:438 start_codon:yes stop_codon:yes gene_type:complete
MASKLKVDELEGVTTAGSIDVTSEGGAVSTNLQQGLAKCWVNFNGTGTLSVRDSLNETSMTDHGTGDYTVNFTNSFNNTDYMVTGSASGNSDASRGYTGKMSADAQNLPASASLRTKFGLGSNAVGHGQLYDSVLSMIGINGDLA